jgi:hypothetical protein
VSLARKPQAIWWELLAARAENRQVVLSLSKRCDPRRLEGFVDAVAVTGMFAIVDGWHVPLEDVLAIARPHYSQKAAA